MRVLHVYISYRCNENAEAKPHANADIHVEGLGNVTVEPALSDETMQRIEVEVKRALRVKLNQRLCDKNSDLQEDPSNVQNNG